MATAQALAHLRSLGHERIGLLLGPRDHVPSQRKLEAARRLREGWAAPLDESLVVHSLYSLEAGQAAATRLLAAGVTAILCASDPMALGAIRAVRRAGLSVPRDISIVGYDDSALMNCTEPPLTTIRQPIEPMGRTVIELLLRQITSDSAIRDELFFEPRAGRRAASDRGPVSAPRLLTLQAHANVRKPIAICLVLASFCQASYISVNDTAPDGPS